MIDELIFKDCSTFSVFGEEINLYSHEFEYGANTVAEVQERFHYLGNVPTTVSTAIVIWQELNKKTLNDDELKQVLQENNLISGAI